MKYRVLWAMDLEAPTPLAAAIEALGYITAAQLFTVYEEEPIPSGNGPASHPKPLKAFKVNLLDASTEEIQQ